MKLKIVTEFQNQHIKWRYVKFSISASFFISLMAGLTQCLSQMHNIYEDRKTLVDAVVKVKNSEILTWSGTLSKELDLAQLFVFIFASLNNGDHLLKKSLSSRSSFSFKTKSSTARGLHPSGKQHQVKKIVSLCKNGGKTWKCTHMPYYPFNWLRLCFYLYNSNTQ